MRARPSAGASKDYPLVPTGLLLAVIVLAAFPILRVRAPDGETLTATVHITGPTGIRQAGGGLPGSRFDPEPVVASLERLRGMQWGRLVLPLGIAGILLVRSDRRPRLLSAAAIAFVLAGLFLLSWFRVAAVVSDLRGMAVGLEVDPRPYPWVAIACAILAGLWCLSRVPAPTFGRHAAPSRTPGETPAPLRSPPVTIQPLRRFGAFRLLEGITVAYVRVSILLTVVAFAIILIVGLVWIIVQAFT